MSFDALGVSVGIHAFATCRRQVSTHGQPIGRTDLHGNPCPSWHRNSRAAALHLRQLKVRSSSTCCSACHSNQGVVRTLCSNLLLRLLLQQSAAGRANNDRAGCSCTCVSASAQLYSSRLTQYTQLNLACMFFPRLSTAAGGTCSC